MRRVSPWDLAFWIIILAIVAVLVRPGSLAGPAMVAISEALAAVITTATGYGGAKKGTQQ